jgi:hypothetical protein
MTELFGLGLFGLGLGLFGSVFGLRLIMPRVTRAHEADQRFFNGPWCPEGWDFALLRAAMTRGKVTLILLKSAVWNSSEKMVLSFIDLWCAEPLKRGRRSGRGSKRTSQSGMHERA